MLKKFILILFIFLASVSGVFAKQDVAIELNASSESVEMGESLQLAISLKHASTEGINIREFKIPGIENFTQTGSSRSSQIQIANGATTAVTETILTLKSNKTGEFTLGPIKLEMNGTIIGESNTVKVVVKAESKKSFFSKGSDEEENNEKGSNSIKKIDYMKIITNLFAFCLLVGMIYVVYKRSNSKEQNVKSVITEKIENSNSINIPDKNDKKFFELAKKNLIKHLETKCNCDLNTLTTQEILEKIENKVSLEMDVIKKILETCDKAKFMAANEDKNELIRLLKSIK